MSLNEKDINSDAWCGVCGSTQICMPFRAKPCGHIFCYYCIQSQVQEAQDQEEDTGEETHAKCTKCGQPVTEIEPFNLLV